MPNKIRTKPDWVTSLNAGRAYIWAAVALSCDIRPDAIKMNDKSDADAPDLAQFWKRYTVALTNIRALRLPIVYEE